VPKPKSRGNGQGTAYKRGKTWEACVTIRMVTPTDPDKKQYPLKRRKGGFPTKAAAIAYCPVLLAGGVEKKAQAPRLSEYWETYKEGEFLKLSKSKQSAYRTAWNKLKPLHDVRVDCITVDLLRKTVSSACFTYDPAKDCKSVLSNLFSLAGADRFADKDLPSYIVLPEHTEKERQPFTETEQASLWKLYESGNKDAAIPLLMIYTGMMPGEAQGLRTEHINLEERTITHAGIKTKVRKATPIVIAASILPLVEDLIAGAQPSGYIWKRDEEEWYKRYYAVLEAAGCRRLTPYSCRHTTATALAITEGIAPQTIKRVMRWSTTKMLDRYAHTAMHDALSAVDTIKKSCG
jgi:integrase